MEKKVLVWDWPLRVFHWLLVMAFAAAYVSEDDALSLHVWAGYLIIVLLLFRLVWGFMGPRYARFSSFICSPRVSWRYFQTVITFNARRYLGHNPAGAFMIILLLISLSLTATSGLLVYAADQNAGPLAGWVGSVYEEFWEELHEFFANLTLLLVIGHIIGVMIESLIHGENLVRAMWTGYKRDEDHWPSDD